MKAIKIHEFGDTEVMKLEEVEHPVPQADEILIKMYASGVNPADYVVRQGGNEILKPFLKLPLGLGLDGAGEIEAMGSDVKGFKKGDKVYGIPNFLGGTYAEFIAAKATQFAIMPNNVSFNEAGSIPSCALMAWNGMDLGKVGAGQRVLINGAGGGIGNLAVQFAKAKGAYVIGTASQRNFGFLKQLGADEVIDYKDENFASLLRDIDVVFDASPVFNEDARIIMAVALKDGGRFVSVQLPYPFSEEFLNILAKKHGEAKMIRRELDVALSLTDIAKLIEEGKVSIIVSKVYPMEKVAESHTELETKHVRGKIVLEIRKEN
ncbi:NADP-dependent oxidoreductase [Mucilaginibacter paludis]|uniref:Alcohol dehydrogenase zinc-binding domain protein n=1 Tax=Mucilaginibacter paludis DSM 18603 TaxID=714943 RepID=H1YIU7_9SPHI|nr:NADP-dependent oxidoreductase [Mucilaginibacter paludis]EHQ27642.1 Alcohol dehydrogenase zinc-binding domain protein [Mucilaginibacter paludis DSM 18603]